MLLLTLATAFAGDLWLDIEAKGDDGQLVLHLPANDLPDSKGDSTLDLNGTKIDLKAEAKSLMKKGSGSKSFPIEDASDEDPKVLTLRMVDPPKKAEPVTQIVLGLKGPMGMGLDLTFPLDGEGDLADLNDQIGGSVDVDGVDLSLSGDDLAQLRRAGPVELVKVQGPGGGGLTIATK